MTMYCALVMEYFTTKSSIKQRRLSIKQRLLSIKQRLLSIKQRLLSIKQRLFQQVVYIYLSIKTGLKNHQQG